MTDLPGTPEPNVPNPNLPDPAATPPAPDFGTPPPPAEYGAQGSPSYGTPVPPPYGAPTPPAYGAPYQGQQQPYDPGVSPEAAAARSSAIVLTIVGWVTFALCCNWIGGLVGGIMGIFAIVKASTDVAASRKLTKNGWIAFGITTVLSLFVLVTPILALFAMVASSSHSG